MLSEYKLALRFAEYAAALGAAVSLWFAFSLYSNPEGHPPLELAFIGGLALLMFTFLPACVLGGEYVRTVRQPTTYSERVSGLNSREVSAVLHWAPTTHKLLAVLGLLIAIAAGVIFGSVSWSTSNPPTREDGIAAALYLSAFFLLPLPVLASAARMPGTYAQSCRSDA